MKFDDQLAWYNGVKCRAVVNEELPGVCVGLFQM